MPDPSEEEDQPARSGLARHLHELLQLPMKVRLSTIFSIWAVLILIMLFTNFPHLVAYLEGDATENQTQEETREQSTLEFGARILENVSQPGSPILVELVCRNTADIGAAGNESNVTVSPFPEWNYNPVFFLQTPNGSTFRSHNSRYGPPPDQSIVLAPGQEVSKIFNLFELPSTGWWIEEDWNQKSHWHRGPEVFTDSGEYRLTAVFYPFFYLYNASRSSISMNATLTSQRPRALSIAHLGEVIWQRTYGGEEMDWARCITRTETGDYIVTGTTKSFGTGEGGVYVVKVDTDGNKVWEKAYRGSACLGNAAHSVYGITQTPDGGFMLVGRCGPPDDAPRQAYVLRIDAEGDKIWERSYGGDQTGRANCIAAAPDGSGYVIAGQTSSFGSGLEVYVFKIDEAGNLVWERTYGGDEAYGIAVSGDGGYVVAGTIYSELSGEYSDNVYLFKIDAEGEKIWEGIFGGSKRDQAEAIARVRDGGFVVVGDSYSFGGTQTDLYALKVDAEGSLVWERNYGGEGSDHAYCVTESHDGGLVIAGSSGPGSFDPSGAFYAIKIDDRGEKVWEITGGPVGRPYGIVQTDDKGYVMAGVITLLGVGDRDFYVLKIKDQAIPITEPSGGIGE